MEDGWNFRCSMTNFAGQRAVVWGKTGGGIRTESYFQARVSLD